MTSDEILAGPKPSEPVVARAASLGHPDTCARPPAGWSGPNTRGLMHFVMYDRTSEPHPELEGWDAFFIAVHGKNYTRWTYRRINDAD
jgi:hypothetical protein